MTAPRKTLSAKLLAAPEIIKRYGKIDSDLLRFSIKMTAKTIKIPVKAV